jgi:glycosyltransferase involved in cell wall biosynthesis
MRTIAIDAVGISQPGGGRSATLNVLGELLRLDTASRYLLLLDQHEPELALGPHVEQIIMPVRHRLLARLWAELTWPRLFRRRGVHLVHHIKNLTIGGWRGRSVVTVYDLTILLHPELYPRSDVLYWRHVQPRALRRCDRVIAISQTTERDLTRCYGLPTDKIAVIYPAYHPRFRPASDAEMARVRAAYGTGSRFVLHVGSLSRKKNLLTLLRAYEQLRQKQADLRLVLVGRQYGKGHDQAFFDHLARSPYREDVVLTGPVPDTDLPALYSAAEVMVFPSLHEGFGIVPLEAMACGTPVVSSAEGALREVLGEAGILVEDVLDADVLAAALGRLLGDETLRNRYRAQGLAWAQRYSVAQAARQTLALYDAIAQAARREP